MNERVTEKSVTPFLEELKELLKKYNYAGIAGVVISNNTAAQFTIKTSPILLHSDDARITVASKVLYETCSSFLQ